MTFVSEHNEPAALGDRLHTATSVTSQLMAEIIDSACRRFPSVGQAAKTARVRGLIDKQAWTDAALSLIDLELPQWHIRRIAYDAGEWYCALSRQRELPEWLDQSIEGRHCDLTLAILSAFVEVQSAAAPASRPSVPAVTGRVDSPYSVFCCDNFA